jgi:phage repressor protein C with HTH and peptisase S24 domain
MSAPDDPFVITEFGRPVNPGFADYAVYVRDDANAPRYEPGEKLYVNSHRLAKEGNDVVVRSDDAGQDFIAQVIRRTEGAVVFRQYNRPGEMELRESSIRSIDVVVLRTT